MSPKGRSFIFFDILEKKLDFQKAQRVPPSTILKTLRFLSLRYGADFRRSRLVWTFGSSSIDRYIRKSDTNALSKDFIDTATTGHKFLFIFFCFKYVWLKYSHRTDEISENFEETFFKTSEKHEKCCLIEYFWRICSKKDQRRKSAWTLIKIGWFSLYIIYSNLNFIAI